LFGIITGFIALARFPYSLLLPFLSRQSTRKQLLVRSAGFSLITLPMISYYSWRTRKLCLLQSGVEFLAKQFLNPSSKGLNYPPPVATEPWGLQFLLEQPFSYLLLLGRRLWYFSGVFKDGWYLPSPLERKLEDFLGMGGHFLFITIFWLFVVMGVRHFYLHTHQRRAGEHILKMIVVLLLPQFLLNSSTRYHLPISSLLFLLFVAGGKEFKTVISDASALKKISDILRSSNL
jgi:hypothetical protein